MLNSDDKTTIRAKCTVNKKKLLAHIKNYKYEKKNIYILYTYISNLLKLPKNAFV